MTGGHVSDVGVIMPKKIFNLVLASFLTLICISVASTTIFAVSNEEETQTLNYSEISIETQNTNSQPDIVDSEIIPEISTPVILEEYQNTSNVQDQKTTEPPQATSSSQPPIQIAKASQPSMTASTSITDLETNQKPLIIKIDDLHTTNHSPIISGYISDNDAIVTIEIYGKEYQAVVKNNCFILENVQLIPDGVHGKFTVKIIAKKHEQKTIETITLYLSPSLQKQDSYTNTKSNGPTVYGYSSLENSDGKMSKSSDLDGDGYSDHAEKLAGTNPNDANSMPDDKGETSSQKTEKLNGDSTEKSKKNNNIQWILIGTAATAFLAFILRDQSNDT